MGASGCRAPLGPGCSTSGGSRAGRLPCRGKARFRPSGSLDHVPGSPHAASRQRQRAPRTAQKQPVAGPLNARSRGPAALHDSQIQPAMGAPVKDAADLGREAHRLEAELQGRQQQALDPAKVEADLAAAAQHAAAGRRQQAIDALLALEKQGRVAEDIAATRKAVTALLQVGVAGSNPPCRMGRRRPASAAAGAGARAGAATRQPTDRAARCPAAPLTARCCPLLGARRCCTRRGTGSSSRSMLCCCPNGARSSSRRCRRAAAGLHGGHVAPAAEQGRLQSRAAGGGC